MLFEGQVRVERGRPVMDVMVMETAASAAISPMRCSTAWVRLVLAKAAFIRNMLSTPIAAMPLQ